MSTDYPAAVANRPARCTGVDAARAAKRIVEGLAQLANGKASRFADLLLQVKRESVADSFMMVLGLVSFGDADWILE